MVAILWEADPERFATNYPDSGIVETYGDQWPDVHCIDYWAYIDRDSGRCRLSVEGWNLPELLIELRGHGGFDGTAIAHTFARILGFRSPGV